MTAGEAGVSFAVKSVCFGYEVRWVNLGEMSGLGVKSGEMSALGIKSGEISALGVK